MFYKVSATLTDYLGQDVTIPETPKRIVSLVPSQTELLYDLGLGNEIVGITRFCVHPEHLRAIKKVVGGTKKVSFVKIRELRPDIIIANKEENTLEMVEELRTIAPVWVTDIATFDDNLQLIATMGRLFDRQEEAQKWIDRITSAKIEFEKEVKNKPIRKAAYFIWKNPWMAAGSGTYIDAMLRLCRFKNIYADKPRYPVISLEDIREGDPEVILLSSEPYPFKENDAFEFRIHSLHAKTIFVDGEMFSWYGSRAAKAFVYFRQLHNRLE